MPADPPNISDKDAKKIAEVIIKLKTEGADKALTQLDKIDNSFRKIQTAAKNAGIGIDTAFTAAISPLTKVASIVGAGLGFTQGIKAVEGYSKSIISLSAQMNKYGQGTGDAINKVEELSRVLSLTRVEAVGLASQFEKTFHTGNLNSSATILEKIRNVVGSNAEAMAKMSGELGAMTMKYPSLQSAMERLGSLDKERLRNHMLMMITTGQMSQQEARGLQDFINQNKQQSAADQKKLDKHKEYVNSMQELRTSFEEISLIIGKALMPMMTKFASLLKENMGTIKSVVGWIEKAVTFFLGWGKYIAIAVIGVKVISGIMGGMLITMKSIQSLSQLFPASGAAASAAAGKAAAASAASAHIAAKQACSCANSGGTNLNYGATPPGAPKIPGAPKTPGVPGAGVAGFAGKAMGALQAVAIMYMAAEVGSSLGGWIARSMGAEEGSTGEMVGNISGNLLGGAAGGAIAGSMIAPGIGTAVGAAVGFALGAVKSIWEIISGNIAAIRKLNEASMSERDAALGAADTGLQRGELSRDTAHAKKHAAIYKDEKNRGVQAETEGDEKKLIAIDAAAKLLKNWAQYAAKEQTKEEYEKNRQKIYDDAHKAGQKVGEDRRANPELVRKLESEDKLRGAKSDAMASVLYGNALGTDSESKSNTKSTLKHSQREIEETMKKEGIKGSVSSLMGKYAKEGANLNVSQKLLNQLTERVKLEDAVSQATSYQAEMASVANMRYEVTLKLRQTESGVLDVLLQKSLLYGNSISNTKKEQEQTLVVQKKLANEMLATVSRQQSVVEDRRTATESLDGLKKELVASQTDAANAKNELDNARDAARNTGDDPKSKVAAAILLSLASANHAAAVAKVKGLEKEVLTTKVSIVDSYEKERSYDILKDKILISIQETHYKIYDNAKKLLDITQQTTNAYGQLVGAMSEQMQLEGTENIVTINNAIVTSKEKLNEQLQRSIELQTRAEALRGSGSKDELKANLRASIIDKNAGDKSPAGQKKTEDDIKEMEAGVDNGTKQLEIEKDIVDAKIRRAAISKALNDQDMIAVNLYEKKKALASAELGITEAYIGLMDQAGMGIGASVQMRMQAIGQTGEVLDQVNKQISELQKQLADPSTGQRQEKELKLKNLMQEQVQLLTKQWELSKALREGWVSALTSQSIASGRITKIMMTKQSNLATAIGPTIKSAISSVTGTNQAGQGARSSSGFGLDAAGNVMFRDPGNAYYKQDYQKEGGEVDPEDQKKLNDLVSRGDKAGAQNLFNQIANKSQAARMSGNGTAYGAGVNGASAQFGPGSNGVAGVNNDARRGAFGAVVAPTTRTGETTPGTSPAGSDNIMKVHVVKFDPCINICSGSPTGTSPSGTPVVPTSETPGGKPAPTPAAPPAEKPGEKPATPAEKSKAKQNAAENTSEPARNKAGQVILPGMSGKSSGPMRNTAGQVVLPGMPERSASQNRNKAGQIILPGMHSSSYGYSADRAAKESITKESDRVAKEAAEKTVSEKTAAWKAASFEETRSAWDKEKAEVGMRESKERIARENRNTVGFGGIRGEQGKLDEANKEYTNYKESYNKSDIENKAAKEAFSKAEKEKIKAEEDLKNIGVNKKAREKEKIDLMRSTDSNFYNKKASDEKAKKASDEAKENVDREKKNEKNEKNEYKVEGLFYTPRKEGENLSMGKKSAVANQMEMNSKMASDAASKRSSGSQVVLTFNINNSSDVNGLMSAIQKQLKNAMPSVT